MKKGQIGIIAACTLFILVLAGGAAIILSTLKKPSEPSVPPASGDPVYLRGDGYDFDLTPYLDTSDLRNASLSPSKITDAVEDMILSVRLYGTDYTTAPLDHPAGDFDRVSITYAGFGVGYDLPDELAEALSDSSGQDIILGTGAFLPAYGDTASFEEQLYGVKTGDKCQITVTFPDDYTDTDLDTTPIQGKKVLFEVVVKEVSTGDLPPFSDSLVTNYTSSRYKSAKEYEEFLYSYYRSVYACNALFDAISITGYPEKEHDEAVYNYLYQKAGSIFGNQGITEDQIKSLYDTYYNDAAAYADKALSERMKLEYLFTYAGITLTDAEYQSALDRDYSDNYLEYYVSYGITTKADLESYMGKSNLILQYLYEKLLQKAPELITIN